MQISRFLKYQVVVGVMSAVVLCLSGCRHRVITTTFTQIKGDKYDAQTTLKKGQILEWRTSDSYEFKVHFISENDSPCTIPGPIPSVNHVATCKVGKVPESGDYEYWIEPLDDKTLQGQGLSAPVASAKPCSGCAYGGDPFENGPDRKGPPKKPHVPHNAVAGVLASKTVTDKIRIACGVDDQGRPLAVLAPSDASLDDSMVITWRTTGTPKPFKINWTDPAPSGCGSTADAVTTYTCDFSNADPHKSYNYRVISGDWCSSSYVDSQIEKP